ncbi:MAG: hypothetical protein JXQ75_00660 [Phycisphaerae bacterium]|nr:hypothetical protein [Phycisphaerae bacterium]
MTVCGADSDAPSQPSVLAGKPRELGTGSIPVVRGLAVRGKTVVPAPKPVVFTVRNGVSEPLFSPLLQQFKLEIAYAADADRNRDREGAVSVHP